MNLFHSIERGLSVLKRYRYQWVFFISLAWAVLDCGYWMYYMRFLKNMGDDPIFVRFTWGAVALRIVLVFVLSLGVGYFLIFGLRERLRRYPILINVAVKIIILIFSFFLINILLHFTYAILINRESVDGFYRIYFLKTFSFNWLIRHSVGWIATFLLTVLIVEVYEKYSPGIFIGVLLGKYINPRDEKRIVMFLDLKDSTPIAEQLGHKEYFKFIRDFIYYISTTMLEYNGHIYQYVGDEIVVSWPFNKKNVALCLKSVIASRKVLQYHSEEFRRAYDVIPEFKVGIHSGTVTIGEVGAVKKDLAMSGNTMNTAARIRSACNELNQKFLVSKDFIDLLDLKEWQAESLGPVELKGKKDSIELFALKV